MATINLNSAMNTAIQNLREAISVEVAVIERDKLESLSRVQKALEEAKQKLSEEFSLGKRHLGVIQETTKSVIQETMLDGLSDLTSFTETLSGDIFSLGKTQSEERENLMDGFLSIPVEEKITPHVYDEEFHMSIWESEGGYIPPEEEIVTIAACSPVEASKDETALPPTPVEIMAPEPSQEVPEAFQGLTWTREGGTYSEDGKRFEIRRGAKGVFNLYDLETNTYNIVSVGNLAFCKEAAQRILEQG